MTTNQTDLVLTSQRERAVIRTGIVTEFAAGDLVVNVSGIPVRAGFVNGIPKVGDTVAVALQDASWLVLGRAASPGVEQAPDVQTGEVPVSFVDQATFTVPVLFPVPYETPPAVVTNIASGAGETARWGSRAISVGTDGFTIFVFECDVADPVRTWAAIPVQWIAHRK